ncbi:11-beta-hydroxysteroid dehydrogenase A-like [Argentina anserina]|uniref:11-beta-hydroxysteroid dehydrogenase A-like n=1 Tax=Argentina anserina TaxID=57926 RepID=UPI002176925C|nr:11-beta-hydroxysteroid dehydrogenase A-like [Potentilla anserina]
MDIFNTLLNIVVPPICLSLLLFILPLYLSFKFLLSIIKSLFPENIAGKVILITGASSGIGEHLAYEYGRRGACLALVARREHRLQHVASRAMSIGSPDVIIIPADVSKVEDCKRFVDATVNHFGRLDHLVNNAGIAPICMFEETPDVNNLAPAMDVNFWGSVYSTYFAIPHLKWSQGRIIEIASAAGWLRVPRLSMYSASKTAVISFYETLRVEIGREVGITIVTPGLVESEMTRGKFLNREGHLVLDQEMRDAEMSLMPVLPVKEAAEEIVTGACQGVNYLTVPAWVRQSFYWKVFSPELLEWCNRILLMSRSGDESDTLSKKILDISGLKDLVYPDTIQSSQIVEH